MSTYRGKPVGTFGHFGCFSFHYTKNINCGEGGALCINKRIVHSSIDTTCQRAAILRDKGTNRKDFIAGKIDRYEWVDIGSSFILSEASSAILLAQLECASDITTKRIGLYASYHSALKELEISGLIRIPSIPEYCQHNAHIFCIILSSEDKLLHYQRQLKMVGIDSFTHYMPLHLAPGGVKFGHSRGPMTVTEQLYKTLLRLPIWIDMTSDELHRVISAVKRITTDLICGT